MCATQVCTGNKAELCFADERCDDCGSDPFGCLGCNAGGKGQQCRFCGFGGFGEIACPGMGAATAAAADAGVRRRERRRLEIPPDARSYMQHTSELRCEVFAGRSACGGASWNAPFDASSSMGEVVTIGKQLSNVTSVYASVSQALCHGYGLPSSPILPGGTPTTVNCDGDCWTGRGYCYGAFVDATSRRCASCVLWAPDPAKGEVLCSEHGVPQGGYLPSMPQWSEVGCDSEVGLRSHSTAALAPTDPSAFRVRTARPRDGLRPPCACCR